MSKNSLILVLGDQLSMANPALHDAVPGRDRIVMAEVRDEASYVPHNRHKIVLIFAAMRHFCEQLRGHGFEVHYCAHGQGVDSLFSAVEQHLGDADQLKVCEPGEFRLRAEFTSWPERLGVSVEVMNDTRFLCSIPEFEQWAGRYKQLRMEYFYRNMRERYRVLLDDLGKPEGGRWNYDTENRKGWRNHQPIPERAPIEHDAITLQVLEEVEAWFPDNPGRLETFNFAVTAEGAQAQLDWFCEHALPWFGTYQDGLSEESPWMFHSLVSMYINIGLLEPLAVCRQVESAWRDGHCSLAAAEGFIRQILGWREYIRGVYWLWMPGYDQHNHFQANTPLPEWFWTGETDMRCLSVALKQSLDLGYAHHIQRLMVIGNFALLAGLSVTEVCEWYLAVYVDAFEWVELPNTLGMALHADGGMMASKPYAASGKYIQRQGNHCQQCRYNPNQVSGEGACPYNSLYWSFIDQHLDTLQNNGRMGLVLKNWTRRSVSEQQAITDWGEQMKRVFL